MNVHKACTEIARILEALENKLNVVVEHISLEEIDTTTFDKPRQYIKVVNISIKQAEAPGTHWR